MAEDRTDEEELERLYFDYEAAAGLDLPFATMEAATSAVAYFEDVAGRAIAALRASRAEVGHLKSLVAKLKDDRRDVALEVERLREDARKNYIRAEEAEQALVAARAELARLRAPVGQEDK